MPGKRSEAELKRLVDAAVAEVCSFPRPGLQFIVENVLATGGRVPTRLNVWGTLHFLARDTPYCCGEPNCHLGLIGERLFEVEEYLRRALQLRQQLIVDLRIRAEYHSGAHFLHHIS